LKNVSALMSGKGSP